MTVSPRPASHNGSRPAIAALGTIVKPSRMAILELSGRAQRERLDFEEQLAAADFGFEDQNIGLFSKSIAQPFAHVGVCYAGTYVDFEQQPLPYSPGACSRARFA